MRTLRLALVAGGLTLGVLAYRVQVDDLGSPRDRAVAIVGAGWAFLVAGLAAWSRRPVSRLGPLMIVAAFALLARQFRYSDDALLFTISFALGELGYALVPHIALSYPSGRVRDPINRAFVGVTYATAIVFPLATLLLYDGTRPLRFFGTPADSLIVVYADDRAAELVQKAFVIFGYGLLASIFVLLIARRLWQATPSGRRVLAPLLIAAAVAPLRAVFEALLTFWSPPPEFALANLFWWQILGLTALPIALLAGLLQTRLAHASVGDLVLRLQHVQPQAIADELARALHDQSLEVAFWLPERGVYVDARGRAVTLPPEGARAVTRLESGGEPLAALVHDPILREEPELVDAAGAAARLALENARLHAEVHAQLANVKESRARLVDAADEERRRIERDLHDGAQQRLVALALELRGAQQRLGQATDPDVERLLEAAVEELRTAVGELRELARGIHPAVLTESGLVTALESLSLRSPFPVTVDAELDERPPASVEATAYFVACEALANVAKHSHARRATVRAQHTDGTLMIEVADDGVGGARVAGGSGLRGLADRVEAHGGRLRVESPPGGGTRVVGEIPCGS